VIKDFSFSPNPHRVHAGDHVLVRNEDTTSHTVTDDDKSFDTGSINGGAVGEFPANATGTFKFHCSIHTYMTAVLEVS
jgi:plastocyanin